MISKQDNISKIIESSLGFSSSSSNSPVKNRNSGDKDTTAFGSSTKYLPKDSSKLFTGRIIEEEGSEMDYNEAPGARLEENKYSNVSNSSENEPSWFDLELTETFQFNSTPRFDKEMEEAEISIMNMPIEESKPKENHKISLSKLAKIAAKLLN